MYHIIIILFIAYNARQSEQRRTVRDYCGRAPGTRLLRGSLARAAGQHVRCVRSAAGDRRACSRVPVPYRPAYVQPLTSSRGPLRFHYFYHVI